MRNQNGNIIFSRFFSHGPAFGKNRFKYFVSTLKRKLIYMFYRKVMEKCIFIDFFNLYAFIWIYIKITKYANSYELMVLHIIRSLFVTDAAITCEIFVSILMCLVFSLLKAYASHAKNSLVNVKSIWDFLFKCLAGISMF